jgi:hypothetical protein
VFGDNYLDFLVIRGNDWDMPIFGLVLVSIILIGLFTALTGVFGLVLGIVFFVLLLR